MANISRAGVGSGKSDSWPATRKLVLTVAPEFPLETHCPGGEGLGVYEMGHGPVKPWAMAWQPALLDCCKSVRKLKLLSFCPAPNAGPIVAASEQKQSVYAPPSTQVSLEGGLDVSESCMLAANQGLHSSVQRQPTWPALRSLKFDKMLTSKPSEHQHVATMEAVAGPLAADATKFMRIAEQAGRHNPDAL